MLAHYIQTSVFVRAKMTKTVKKSNPAKWERLKRSIKAGGKGGKPGQWSARKAQLLSNKYKSSGGKFKGSRKDTSLHHWTTQNWGTKSGKNSVVGKNATGERYLPEKDRKALSKKEYAATSRKKREDLKKGKQNSAQPAKVQQKLSKDKKKSSKNKKK